MSSLARIALLLLASTPTLLASDPAASSPPDLPTSDESVALFDRAWRWSALGTDIGAKGLHILDLDGDGVNEVVATSRPDYWSVLRWNGAGYEQEWTSPRFSAPIVQLDVLQTDEDAALEVVVVAGTSVQVVDGGSLEVQATWSWTGTVPNASAAGDVDGDGAIEVVLVDTQNLWVRDLATGSLESGGAGYGGWALALCQTDQDPQLEIVVAKTTQPGYVLDGATHAVEWSRSAGLGDVVSCGDLDGDSRDEIASGWINSSTVRTFDLPSGTGLSFATQSGDLAVVRVANLDNDGQMELLCGGRYGSVQVLDGTTGQVDWSLPGPDGRVTRFAVGDADGDGVVEIAWGSGSGTSAETLLAIGDGQTHLVEWTSRDLRGPFHAMARADLAGDGVKSLVVGSNSSWGGSGLADGVLLAFDPIRGRQIPLATSIPPASNISGLTRARAANLDADPQDEICSNSGDWYVGRVRCVDGLTGGVEWQVDLPEGLGVASMAIADLDGDGEREVVAGTRILTDAAAGVYVYCFRGSNGALKWRSPSFGWAELWSLEVGNVDADPALEVVVAKTSFDQQLYVVDGGIGAIERGPLSLPTVVGALELVPAAGSAKFNVLAGLSDGTVRKLDLESGNTTVVISGLDGEVTALASGEVDVSSGRELAVAAGGAVTVFDSTLSTPLWSSGPLGSDSTVHDSLLFADLDADGRDDLVVDTAVGVEVFLTAPAPGLPFADSAESAGLRLWSRQYPGAP